MNKGWRGFMDRRVKERLVGATILVVLIVLIVPEMLSGPKRPRNAPPAPPASAADPVRNVTVDLATSRALPAADSSASAAPQPAEQPLAGETTGDRSRPPAAAAPTITTLQPQQPVTSVLENDAPPPRSGRAIPKAAAPREAAPSGVARHNWAVQIGSFASYANAEKLERRLKAQSFPAFISSSGAGRTLRYRVRVGPMADRASAEKAVARLRKEGHSATAIAL